MFVLSPSSLSFFQAYKHGIYRILLPTGANADWTSALHTRAYLLPSGRSCLPSACPTKGPNWRSQRRLASVLHIVRNSQFRRIQN